MYYGIYLCMLAIQAYCSATVYVGSMWSLRESMFISSSNKQYEFFLEDFYARSDDSELLFFS